MFTNLWIMGAQHIKWHHRDEVRRGMLRTSLLVILRVEWIDFDTMFGGEHQFEGLHRIVKVGTSGFRSPISMAGDFEESLATLTPKQPALPPPGVEMLIAQLAQIAQSLAALPPPGVEARSRNPSRHSSDCAFPESAPKRAVTCGRQDCEWKFHKTLRVIVNMCSVIFVLDYW